MAFGFLGRQHGGALPSDRGRRPRPTTIGDNSNLFEDVGDGLVGPDARRGQVPRPLVGVADDQGQGSMRFAHRGRPDGVAYRGSHQWMAEFDGIRRHPGDARGFCGRQISGFRGDAFDGTMDLRGVRVVSRGDDGQRTPRAVVERVDSIDERASQVVADGELVWQRGDAGQLIVVELSRQFDQRERAAFGGLDTPQCNGAIGAVAQQDHRVVDVEPPELDGLETCVAERRWHAGAFADDCPHGLVRQALQRKGQRCAGRIVDPLGVVDEQQQRRLLAGRGEGGECGAPDCQLTLARSIADGIGQHLGVRIRNLYLQGAQRLHHRC